MSLDDFAWGRAEKPLAPPENKTWKPPMVKVDDTKCRCGARLVKKEGEPIEVCAVSGSYPFNCDVLIKRKRAVLANPENAYR